MDKLVKRLSGVTCLVSHVAFQLSPVIFPMSLTPTAKPTDPPSKNLSLYTIGMFAKTPKIFGGGTHPLRKQFFFSKLYVLKSIEHFIILPILWEGKVLYDKRWQPQEANMRTGSQTGKKHHLNWEISLSKTWLSKSRDLTF